MSHRVEDKEARRAERLRLEEHERRRERLRRRSGYAAVGIIAVGLVMVAALSGGGGGGHPVGASSATAGGATVGTPAPAFTLTDVVSNRPVNLGSLRGEKTLLFFSEGVGCQACMVQIADLQRNNSMRSAGIRLVSVTTDAPGDLAQAARQYGIRTPLLADSTGAMSAAYGMLGHGGMGHPTQDGHAFMLLDPRGKILWHQAYQEMFVPSGRLMSDMRGAM